MAVNAMSVADGIGYAAAPGTGTGGKSGISVDTNTFLKLLVTQLQYQDPLEPQTDTAFVTQLAQMTSLEQMQQMNATLSSTQAYDMIGKVIYAEVLNPATGITECYLGPVDSVLIREGVSYVLVDNTAISVSDIRQVFDSALFETGGGDEGGEDGAGDEDPGKPDLPGTE
ncbi:MAG TPA: hypothetical protein DD735_11170 [Clostridiales bacterium]|nr:hypothetical protein [Clostridiales bacterium]